MITEERKNILKKIQALSKEALTVPIPRKGVAEALSGEIYSYLKIEDLLDLVNVLEAKHGLLSFAYLSRGIARIEVFDLDSGETLELKKEVSLDPESNLDYLGEETRHIRALYRALYKITGMDEGQSKKDPLFTIVAKGDEEELKEAKRDETNDEPKAEAKPQKAKPKKDSKEPPVQAKKDKDNKEDELEIEILKDLKKSSKKTEDSTEEVLKEDKLEEEILEDLSKTKEDTLLLTRESNEPKAKEEINAHDFMSRVLKAREEGFGDKNAHTKILDQALNKKEEVKEDKNEEDKPSQDSTENSLPEDFKERSQRLYRELKNLGGGEEEISSCLKEFKQDSVLKLNAKEQNQFLDLLEKEIEKLSQK